MSSSMLSNSDLKRKTLTKIVNMVFNLILVSIFFFSIYTGKREQYVSLFYKANVGRGKLFYGMPINIHNIGKTTQISQIQQQIIKHTSDVPHNHSVKPQAITNFR